MSVAAELVGIDPQSLRLYERKGLITPDRSAGGTRRYSPDDLERLRRIKELLGAGLNLVGIALVLDLETTNHRLRAQAERSRGGRADRRADHHQVSNGPDGPEGEAQPRE